MKLLTLILFLCLSFIAKSQEIYSLYFEVPQPSNIENKGAFGEDIIGIYQKDNNKLVDLVVEQKAIISRYLTPIFLTTDEINKNPKYEFKKNLLHGIDSTKGLEYYIENDTVYFGIFKKDTLFAINESSLLRKDGINYFLSQKKGSVWEVSLVYVKDKNLYLRYIDVTQEEEKANKYLNLSKKTINQEKVYLSKPTPKNFMSFVEVKGFYDIIKYIKE
jgi:hypothetical protein